MLSQASQLAAAQLALYILLIIPSIYILYKHGWRGFVGWFFLFAFCSLRIIGSGLQISDEKNDNPSTTAQTISGVGLSPLVLLFVGVLRNHYLTSNLKGPGVPTKSARSIILTSLPSILLHFLVLTALALVVVGYQPSQAQKSGKALQETGYIIFVLIVTSLIILTSISWKRHRHSTIADAKRLLIAITTALPFLSIRVLYSLISTFDASINAFSGPITYRIILAVLMELLVVIIFTVFGILTRNIKLLDHNGKSIAAMGPSKVEGLRTDREVLV